MGKLLTVSLGDKVGEITKIKFKNGETYEIIKWDKDVYGFRDAICYQEMDSHWDHHSWEKSDLKKFIENWWKKNAPDELVTNFKVTIPSCENVFGKDLPSWQTPKKGEKQFEYFKDWRHRLIGLKGENHTTWWWTKSPYSGSTGGFVGVYANGSANYYNANNNFGVVPCFLKK